ncbi:MAG: 50S ribosomal protein L24 [Alphaproteobacteria bacterium 16-39-46]|nr:MAG: 50S ribosomal protein L24 [Alphaproteobacteria bacterium 16-39-46]OZA42915.1 MAG: 50S ribosomal protein L24 [Alphaproteobacteria bacterium 17-39-52]HQS84221.1 50S ribosomal protein L24 [Alphaproteobacteria bacterium]HQS94076.1 50S ribosomal protein L24 [Alphaproteobacteria bacterium]
MTQNWRIRTGDEIIVISGKEKGKTGKVVRVLKSRNRLYVGGVNMIKKHQKPTASSPGGIIQKEASLHVSNVAHVDPVSKKATRVGYKFLESGRKVRFAKRSQEIIGQ